MKKFRLPGLWLMLLAFGLQSGLAQAAPRWTYKGQKQWHMPDGRSFPADYAEQIVGDDALALIFDREARQWHVMFIYNGDRKFYHSTDRAPELFVRTQELNGKGRFDSDYLISHRPQTFTNGSHQPQFVLIGIEPRDLPYLKIGLDLGVSYYVENECVTPIEGESCIQMPRHRTFLFAGNKLEEVITEIETRNGLAVSQAILRSQPEGAHDDKHANEKSAR